jgi:hypothetical protein
VCCIAQAQFLIRVKVGNLGKKGKGSSDLQQGKAMIDMTASTTVPGTVEEAEKPSAPGEPEKANIAVKGPDGVHKVISIENTLTDQSGHNVHLKSGEKVEVTVKPENEPIRFGR